MQLEISSFEKLSNLDDMFGILGTGCHDCEEFGRDAYYNYVKKTGKFAEYSCSFFSSHRCRILAGFVTSEDEIKSLIESKPDKPDYKTWEAFSKKLQVAAEFAAPETKLEFDGYCLYCGKETKVEIKDRRVWYGCSECATLIADSFD